MENLPINGLDIGVVAVLFVGALVGLAVGFVRGGLFVLSWLGAARQAGATVLIGDAGRSYFPRESLYKLAEYQVPTTRELEDMEVKKTAVWALP